MTRTVSKETRNRQSEAAKVRWDPILRREAILKKIIALVEGYMIDHNTMDLFTREQVYIILAAMNYRTENPGRSGRNIFDGSEELLP